MSSLMIRTWIRPALLVQRRFNSILSNLVSKCNSCGIPLQLQDPKKAGFIPILQPKPFEKPEDSVYELHLAKLSKEDLQLLNLDTPESTKKSQKHVHDGSEYKECLRCRDIKYRNEVDPEHEAQSASTESLLEKLDEFGVNMIYTINGVDFPVGINQSILKRHKPVVVITKADLIFHSVQTSLKYRFYKQYLERKYGIPPERVFLVSSTKNWGLDKLNAYILANPGKYYIVGDINSGKSSLISRLVFNSKGDFRTKYVNWCLKNGPGISNLPGFTRDDLAFKVTNYELIDLPGFNRVEFPDFKKFKNVFKNMAIYKYGAYDLKYKSLRGGQVYTVGGLFYIRLPEEYVSMQVKKLINFDDLVLRDMDKIVGFEQSLDASLRAKFLVAPTTKLKRYVVPPFVGKVDLVVKNLGYIEITPTGAKASNSLLEVYIPENLDLEIVVRRPIINYVQKILSGRDKKGNPLNQANKFKSTKVVKSYTNEVFSSRLYPFKNSQFDSVERVCGIPYNEDTIVTRQNFTDYWTE